jgi:cobalt-zinc-cadmium efflux system protein
MSTGHAHGHGMAGAQLRAALLLTCLILGVELVAGVLAHSLALLSDAGHVLTDIVALGLAWFATLQAERPSNADKTYGYHRTGILAALANAVTLILIVAVIAFEAVQRFQHPPHVTPWLMFSAAAVGIAVNLWIASRLHGEAEHNLNVRAASLHVMGDVAASAGVVVAGIVILVTGWSLADPIVSVLIALLIARGAWLILRETLDILMEATPRDLDVSNLVRDMSNQPGVNGVHDLHVWSIAGGMRVLSAHVQLLDDAPLSRGDRVVGQLNHMLADKYHIAHSTIQLECFCCESPDLYCGMRAAPVPECGHEGSHAH